MDKITLKNNLKIQIDKNDEKNPIFGSGGAWGATSAEQFRRNRQHQGGALYDCPNDDWNRTG